MAKKQNNPAKDEALKKNAMKQERFNAGSDTGEFKKERAGPAGSAKAGGKTSVRKDKPVSEAQGMFTQGTENKTGSKSEQMSRKANQEFFSKHEQEDERNTEYASQREETRARRIHRQHDTRTRVKDSFIQSDGDFHDKTGFVEEAGAELSFSPPEPQAARANNSRSARASDSGFLSFILISPYRSIIVRKRLPASEA